MRDDFAINKLIQMLWENPHLIDKFLNNPTNFAKNFKIHLSDAEMTFLSSIDKATIKEYIKNGFDSRISKCLWAWYYKRFLGSNVIHAIPNCSYGGISVHQSMLSDISRNLYFKRAIEAVVNSNAVVADVGTGTGILAIWASKVGAKKVFGIEKDAQIMKLASELIRENQAKNIILINNDASKLILPEKVDIIISECLGSFGINSTFIPSVIRFKEKNLKNGGIVIPKIISLVIVPYETIFYNIWVDFAKRDVLGISIESLDKYLKNQIFTIIGDSAGFLSTPKEFWSLNLSEYTPDTIQLSRKLKFIISRDGVLHGFVGWFKAYLTENIILDTSPANPRTHWYHIFLPIKEPIEINKGDSIQIELDAKISQHTINWKWVAYVGCHKFEHNTEKSYPSKSIERFFGGVVSE